MDVLEKLAYNGVFTDVERPPNSNDGTQPYHGVARFELKRLNSSKALGEGAEQLLKENIACILKRFELDFEVDQVMNSLSSRIDFSLIREYGESVDCHLECERRRVKIKREMNIRIVNCTSSSLSEDWVLAYRGSNQMMFRSPACNCRHHDNNCELHSSYLRLSHSSTSWGIPLLFYKHDDGVNAVMLSLKRRSNKYEDKVIAQCNVDPNGPLQIVSLNRLRTRCLMKFKNGLFYVFVGGERAFKHLQ